jgi:PBSX family phage terminase large subunit
MAISDKQIDFLINSIHDINLASGAIRSGKTWIVNIRFLEFLENQAINNIDILITGKKSDAVERNVIHPFLELCEQEGIDNQFIYTRSPRKLIYKPKNIICYIEGANDEGAEPRIRGMTTQAWLADEVTLYPKSFFLQAIGRCSAGFRFKFLTCNPDSPSHYIQTEIIDKVKTEKIDGKVWYFTLDDNPVLNEEYIDQIKNLYSGVFYDRFISGKWVQSEGVVYDKFIRAQHLFKEYLKNQIKEYLIGIDWGYENPLVLLLIAVDFDDRYFVVDEIYAIHQLIDNELLNQMVRKGWFELKRGDIKMPISYAYADPSRPDYIHLFYQLTKIPCIPAVNSVIEGIQCVQKLLMKRKDETYGLTINESCINFIKEIESYRWKTDKQGEGKDEPIKEMDHGCDAIRYALFTYSRGRVKVIDGSWM